MEWLILNLLLLMFIIALSPIFNPDDEYPITELLSICFIGFAFFSIVGMAVQPEIVEKLLKKTATFEAIIIFLILVATALQVIFRKKEKLLRILVTLAGLLTLYSCGEQSQFIDKSELIGSWKVFSEKGSIHLGGLAGRQLIVIRLKADGTAEYFASIPKKWNPFGHWKIEGSYLSFPIGNSIVNFGNKLKYLGKQDRCLLFYDVNWKDNYKFCREQ